MSRKKRAERFCRVCGVKVGPRRYLCPVHAKESTKQSVKKSHKKNYRRYIPDTIGVCEYWINYVPVFPQTSYAPMLDAAADDRAATAAGLSYGMWRAREKEEKTA